MAANLQILLPIAPQFEQPAAHGASNGEISLLPDGFVTPSAMWSSQMMFVVSRGDR